MLMPIITAELAKVALNKISELKMEEVVKALETLRRASTGGAMLVPGLGALGVGIAVGASLGVLFAPRSGAETRTAVRDMVRSRVSALRTRLGKQAGSAEPVESRAANGGAVPETRSTN